MTIKRSFKLAIIVVAIILVLPGVAFADEGKGELPNLLEVISPALQTLIEALVAAIIPFLVYHVKRYLDEATARVKQALTAEQYAMVEIIVSHLVHAAEQMYSEADGDAKKNYVLRRAQEELASYGLHLDLKHLDDLIESMVRQELKVPLSHPLISS